MNSFNVTLQATCSKIGQGQCKTQWPVAIARALSGAASAALWPTEDLTHVGPIYIPGRSGHRAGRQESQAKSERGHQQKRLSDPM